MKPFLVVAFVFVTLGRITAQKKNFSAAISSPDGKVQVLIFLTKENSLEYSVSYNGLTVLQGSKLGVVMEDEDYTTGIRWKKAGEQELVQDEYKMLTAKKSLIKYSAVKRTIHLQNKRKKKFNLIFQVSDDGVAFRYEFPQQSDDVKKIKEEKTTFRFNGGTRAWLQPKTEAQSGWEHSNPSYEAHYMMDIKAGTPSPGKNGWVFPALFKYNDVWILITETALGRTYCGAALQQFSDGNEYRINFPQEAEKFTNGVLYPESKFPWLTPWRIIAIGSLKTIAESTLGTDLALPAIKMDTAFIKPGRASWSWIMSKDNFIVYDEQKKYIDFAANMGWEYCLVDAAWDKKIGYEKMKELAVYAASKKVGLLLWYNSAGGWNTVKYTPKDKLLTHEDRVKEFSLLKQMGIKGIKVDFFGGDGQSFINYYQDILQDAAEYHLLVNFHGATLPRGWQRTYPNLMTMEAVYGYEMITFNQKDADAAPPHMVMSALVRNAFDPMDFTPVNLYEVPKIQRRTSITFEMATAIIFLSGIQHFAESPDGMAAVSPAAKEFMKKVPVQWDDVKFIDGYPGKFLLLARRSGNKWYVAGINAEKDKKLFRYQLPFIEDGRQGKFYFTNDAGELMVSGIENKSGGMINSYPKTNDGFVIVFE